LVTFCSIVGITEKYKPELLHPKASIHKHPHLYQKQMIN